VIGLEDWVISLELFMNTSHSLELSLANHRAVLASKDIIIGYVPKHHFREKFYSKCIVNVTYTIIYRVKFSLKRRFGT